jgi:hypothetical protein
LAADLSLFRQREWQRSKALLRDSASSTEDSCSCDRVKIREAVGILLTVLGNIDIDSIIIEVVDVIEVVVILVSGENSNSVVLDRESISTRGSPRAGNSVIFDVSCHNANRSGWAGTSCQSKVSSGETLSANVGGNNADSVNSARLKVGVHIFVSDKARRG